MINFIEELKWRGMLKDHTQGIEQLLEKEQVTAYIGFDPTAISLGVGNLACLMMLILFQKAGHKPIVVVGGATGMVGDPSFKKEERNTLSEESLQANLDGQRKQLEKYLDFDPKSPNAAIMLNNYDWFKNMSVLDFLRDIGKCLTVNYMMSKDSVKSRLEGVSGISFTEFSYQLVQGYDFKYLNDHYNCKLQMGGSDQFGNMTAGIELIRRTSTENKEAHVITCPLVTKADGTKFGKTESGNIWLDPQMTSPYQFYQFWLNTSDEDAKIYIRRFTFLTQNEVQELEKQHFEAPHLRILQKKLGQEVTTFIHGEQAYNTALQSTEILFGNPTAQQLAALPETQFLEIFEGIPTFNASLQTLQTEPIPIADLLANAGVFSSKGEARRAISPNGVIINKEKITDPNLLFNTQNLLNNKYLLVQKGKKNYNLVIFN